MRFEQVPARYRTVCVPASWICWHVAHRPTAYAAGAWPFYVSKYGPRAGLFGEERARVLAWLQASAR